MRNTALLLLASLMLAGCATDINLINASRYHEAGLRAEWSGDYKAAEEYFKRSLINARDGHASDSVMSMSMYNLGRMKGLNCQYDEAHTLLTASLKLQDKISGPENALFSKRLFELARLSYDRKQYAEAADYYARAIPLGQKLGLEIHDPGAAAEAMDEYSIALRNSGRIQPADKIAADAEALRARSANAKPKYTFQRYTRTCSG